MPPVSNGNDQQHARDQDRAARGFRSAADEATAGDHGEADSGLSAMLAGIAQEVQAQAGMERAGIMGSFAAKVLYARKSMNGPQLAAMLRTLKQERTAALKSLAQRSAMELKGLLAAARRRYARSRTKPPGQG